MELEELKTIWASVDERLKKQEILKESIIREMIYKKANKSLNVLQWLEFLGITLILALIPFIIWAYGKFGGWNLYWDIYVLFALVVCIALIPYLVYKAYLLIKIDLAGSVKNNMFYINKYKAIIKKEKIILNVSIGTPFVILLTLILIKQKAPVFLWVLTICIIIFVSLYTYWSYKKLYDKNIESIQKNLEELEELKEMDASKT